MTPEERKATERRAIIAGQIRAMLERHFIWQPEEGDLGVKESEVREVAADIDALLQDPSREQDDALDHADGRPIRPHEVPAQKIIQIPPVVFDVVNAMIVEKGASSRIVLRQRDIVDKLIERGLSREEIMERHWLDFEPAYRAAGWTVIYDKPGYNETYPATFEFRSPDY